MNLKYFQIFICLILLFTMLSELFLHIQPCQLCLYQRILWILILISCFFKSKTFILLCCMLLLSNISVGLYQFLSQIGLINTMCNIDFNNPSVPCNTFDIYVFNKGISFALINAIIGIISLVYIYKVAKK